MSVFIRKEDADVFKEHEKEILAEVEIKRLATLEPTKDKIEGSRKVIFDFIRRKKRKLYGGQAQNILIKAKNPKDAIYHELEYKDIEFYSPDILRDAIELADELYAKGFKKIDAKEAQHFGTVKLFVDMLETVDLSFVNRNVYNRIPYEEIDGLWIASPSWMFVNTLRVVTDMLTGIYRLEKDLTRGYLMQKYYPMKLLNREPKHEKPAAESEFLRNAILEWCTGKESVIQIGELGCEYYKTLKIPSANAAGRLDIISTNFAADSYDIYHYLEKIVGDKKDKLVSLEYYPFYEYTGHRFTIWYMNKPVVQVFSYNKRCTPYRDIKYGKNSFLRMGTFSLILMYNYVMFHISRVNKEESEELNWRWQIQTCIDARNKYLKDNKKTIYDKTAFGELRVQCTGKALDAPRAMRLRSQAAHKNREQKFKYNPEDEIANAKKRATRDSGGKSLKERQDDLCRQKFFNASGNPIKKEKNFKVHLDQPRPQDYNPTEEQLANEDGDEGFGEEPND
jgi:hypothetical protein